MRSLFLFFVACAPLFSEIESVIISFRKELCNTEPCLRTLSSKFKMLPEVAEVNVSPGEIVLSWDPEKRFSFQRLDTQARQTGISLRDSVTLTVRGTVRQEGEKFYLVSFGDNTRFQLLNPPTPSDSNLLQYNTIENYSVLPNVKLQLQEAVKKKEMVRVSGWLLAPWRYNLTLVMTNLSVEKKAPPPKKPKLMLQPMQE